MNIDSLEKMLKRGRDDALLRFSLGSAYLQADQPQSAVEHLRAAIAHKPDYSAAWNALGKALMLSGQWPQACAVYEQGITAAQNHGDLQAAKEMEVFLRRAQKASALDST